MNYLNKRVVCLFLLAGLMCSVQMFAAAPVAIESGRAHTAAGNFGCTVSGATNATPIVVTCAAAHGLIDGDQIQITGVVGNTAANTTGYAKVTTFSSTTFGLYSNTALSTGVAGNGAYSSGGLVSIAYDISGWTDDWTIRLRIDSITAGKKVLVSVQDSADGFVSDIKTLEVVNINGAFPSMQDFTIRSYQRPSARFGLTNGRLRVLVQSIDSATTATITLRVE